MTWTRLVSLITGLLVLGLSTASFILSYTALRAVSLSAVLPELSWLWPLVIDGAMVVFALVVVYFALVELNNFWPGLLVGVFTFATVGFNAVHAPQNWLSVSVAIMPPIVLFLSFETFMWIVKAGIQRKEVNDSLGTLRQTRDKLKGQVDKLQQQLDRGRDRLTELRDTIKDKQAELETEQRQPFVIVGLNVDNLRNSPDKRLPIIQELLDIDIPRGEIAELLDISTKTLSRDIKALTNGNERG